MLAVTDHLYTEVDTLFGPQRREELCWTLTFTLMTFALESGHVSPRTGGTVDNSLCEHLVLMRYRQRSNNTR